MSCGCIYVSCDEPTETMHNCIYKAVGTRQCDECGKRIEKGEYYEYERYDEYDERDRHINSGTTHITCADCLSIRDEFFCDGWYWGAILEYLYMHIDEMDGEIDSDCLSHLTPGAKDIVIGYIDKVFAELKGVYED